MSFSTAWPLRTQNSALKGLISLPPFPTTIAEDGGYGKSGNDVPDAPPGGDEEHTTVLQFGREDVGVEQQDKAET